MQSNKNFVQSQDNFNFMEADKKLLQVGDVISEVLHQDYSGKSTQDIEVIAVTEELALTNHLVFFRQLQYHRQSNTYNMCLLAERYGTETPAGRMFFVNFGKVCKRHILLKNLESRDDLDLLPTSYLKAIVDYISGQIDDYLESLPENEKAQSYRFHHPQDD